MNTAIIGVGSNIEPLINIEKAKAMISQDHKFLGESEFVKTKPIGIEEQPDFLNGVFLISTELSFEELKAWLKRTESVLGRLPTTNRYDPRTIDLDILIWNEQVVHEDVYHRDFIKKAVLRFFPNLKI
jgi:2-amino-4-hydroxy-6-hydroxymethyldihydropteridine diphosphokinase